MGEAQRIQIEQHGFAGMLWFAGWLFTIGYADLDLLRGLFALVIWPYYLGTTFGPQDLLAPNVAPPP